MATIYYVGGVTAVSQVVDFTPGGTIEVGDEFIITLKAEDGSTTQAITASATATTVAQTCADLLAAWNASTVSLKSGITAANNTTKFTLTGTAGTPFYAAASTTESDGSAADAQTFTASTTTPNKGNSDWNTAAVWSGGSVPTTGDTVYLRNGSADLLYGLDQHGVTLAGLYIESTWTGSVGSASYYLRIGATALQIGDPSRSVTAGTGSGRIKVDTGTAQTTAVIVFSAANSTDAGLEPVRLKGSHASNSLSVTGPARVGSGTSVPGETATWATVAVTHASAVVTLDTGCTLTTVNQEAGQLTARAGCTTVNQSGGTLYANGSGAITTANVNGTAVLSSTGTITTLNVQPNGNADFSQDPRARTVTNCNLYPGATLNLDNGSPLSVTLTNGIKLNACGLDAVTIRLSKGRTLTLS